MEKTQLLKGVLECCILKIIETNVTYGYEIVTQLEKYGFKEVKEGTIYPLLMRLEKKRLIVSEFKSSPLGPKRKYYSLTEEGEQYMNNFYYLWKEVCDSIEKIWEQEE